MSFHIRPFTPGDYTAMLVIDRAIYPDFTNNLTGVKRAYRHRGIALALKMRGIAYAREHGGTFIKTWNDSPNAPMIAINMQLGFVRKVGWITFLKEFEPQDDREVLA